MAIAFLRVPRQDPAYIVDWPYRSRPTPHPSRTRSSLSYSVPPPVGRIDCNGPRARAPYARRLLLLLLLLLAIATLWRGSAHLLVRRHWNRRRRPDRPAELSEGSKHTPPPPPACYRRVVNRTPAPSGSIHRYFNAVHWLVSAAFVTRRLAIDPLMPAACSLTRDCIFTK